MTGPSKEDQGNGFTGFRPYGISGCPRCDYDLTGLPSQHACPECGFAYDEHTMVWKRIRPTVRIPWRYTLEAVPSFLLFSIVVWQAPVIFGINRWLLIICIVAIAAGLYRLLRGPRLLCLSPSGVEIYPRGILRPTVIRWLDVGVTHSMDDRYYLTRMTRSQSINISVFFERPDEHQEFEIALADLRKRYG